MSLARSFRELERQESRVLGALRCVDAATGATIDSPLDVRSLDAAPARLLRNRSGLYVVRDGAALAAHAESFLAPPAQPAIGSLRLRLAISDPTGAYLPRTLSLPLPRDPAAGPLLGPDSLFLPMTVPLYPAPGAATGANWSLLRLSLRAQDNGDALGGALLRVRRNGVVIARGLSDWRGEALVAVVGVPVTTFSDDENAVVVSAIEVSLDAVFDPRPNRDSSGLRSTAAALAAGRAAQTQPAVDPDVLEAELEIGAPALLRGSVVLSIAARSSRHCRLLVAVPP